MSRPRIHFDERKICKWCGKEFIHSAKAKARGHAGNYCSNACARTNFKTVGKGIRARYQKIRVMQEAGFI